MYLSHYNIVEKPFQITTDPKFLWLGEKHQEALATLKYGVLDGKGFLLLTGDVGTGKTTLINALVRDLDSNVIVATIVDPNLEKMEFFRFLARAFAIEDRFTEKVDFLAVFSPFLNEVYAKGKKVLLVIDEAQRLSIELLEEIRLLSNIEKENAKLLNIFFVGQDEFNGTLTEEECRALRQRIVITHQINALSADETREYIKYRLKVAGTEVEIFDRKAIQEVYAFSNGYPRLINIICDHALLTAFVRDLKTIDAAIVKECAQELTIPGEDRPTHAKEPATTRKMQRSIWRRAALYVCLFLAVAFSAHLIRILGYDERGVGPGDGDIGAQETSARINKPEVSQANGAKAKEPDADSTRPARYLSAGVAHYSPGDERQPQERSHSSVVDNGQPLPFSDGKLTIQFQFGTAELREDMFDMLDGVATVMAQKRKMVILVKGYADSLGLALYNKTLSEARANAVKDYLAAKGISPLRIRTFSMGEENPLRSNATSAGRRANRRAEIEVKR